MGTTTVNGAGVASGILVQRVASDSSSTGSTTSAIPFDATKPQNTEGDEAITVSITPKDSSNILVIKATIHIGASVSNFVNAALFKDSDADALISGSAATINGTHVLPLIIDYEESAGSTTSRTYKVRYGAASGTGYLNQAATANDLGNTLFTRLEVLEFLPAA